MTPRKKATKSETVIDFLCFTHKTALEKDGRNSTKTRFSH